MPKKMVVVGSGAIGVEFACFYNSMGADVTLVEYLPNSSFRRPRHIKATWQNFLESRH